MNTAEVLDLLRTTADAVVNPRFRSLSDDQIAEKNPGDLVTVADRESEQIITAALQDAYPDALVLGEEAVAEDEGLLDRFRTAGHAFTVDPVDGTKNFVNGSPDHAVMAAELRDGVVERAWIWQPQHEVAYVAEIGRGAWRNAERLTRRPPVGSALRGVTSRRRLVGTALPGLPPLGLTWLSCGVDYPHLAEGDADYIVYGRAMPWDHAPGSLLLTEAGGVVGLVDGRPYRAQDPIPVGLVAAADQATLERVRAALAHI